VICVQENMIDPTGELKFLTKKKKKTQEQKHNKPRKSEDKIEKKYNKYKRGMKQQCSFH
jgi:hypothetical protein